MNGRTGPGGKAETVLGNDPAKIVAVMKEVVDLRPVRYTIEGLRSFADQRIANRPRGQVATITVGDARAWARDFAESTYDRGNGHSDLDNVISREVARNRRYAKP